MSLEQPDGVAAPMVETSVATAACSLRPGSGRRRYPRSPGGPAARYAGDSARQASANAAARAPSSAADRPGVYSAEPEPEAAGPASK